MSPRSIMDRRTFCLSSAAVVACCRTGRTFGLPSPGVPIVLDRVLFDSRYAECRSFAAAARRCGHETAALEGDVTRLWYDTLCPRWAAGGGAIAGMTAHSSLFCLEQLAKDHWMRVVIRIEHRSGIPSHRITASDSMLTRSCAALDARPAWPGQVASLLTACGRAKDQPHSIRVIPRLDADAPASRSVNLVSWVIAA
jgi:hypothetical protein